MAGLLRIQLSSLDNPAQVPSQLHPETIRTVRIRTDHHASHQLAEQLVRLNDMFGRTQQILQSPYLRRVDRSRVGQGDLGLRGPGGLNRQFATQVRPLGLPGLQRLHEGPAAHPGLDLLDDAGDPRLHIGQFAREDRGRVHDVVALQRDLAPNLGGERLDQLGREEAAAQALQNTLLELLALDLRVVRTHGGALRLAIVATVAVLPDDRVAAAADIAGHQARQDVLGAIALVQRRRLGAGVLFVGRLQALLHLVPDLVRDDLQLRALAVDDVLLVGGAGDAIAGVRVSAELVAAVDDDADISLVAQHPVALLRVPADRAVVPVPARGARHALRVQGLGDGVRGFAGGVVAEDPANDAGLVHVDLAIEVGVAADRVPVGEPGRDSPARGCAAAAAAGLVAGLARLELGDCAVERDHAPGNVAAVGGAQSDVSRLEPFGEARDVAGATADPLDPLATSMSPCSARAFSAQMPGRERSRVRPVLAASENAPTISKPWRAAVSRQSVNWSSIDISFCSFEL